MISWHKYSKVLESIILSKIKNRNIKKKYIYVTIFDNNNN